MTNDTPNNRAVLTVTEAAYIAHVGHNRVRDWVRSGKLPTLPGRRILIPRVAYEEFLVSIAQPNI